MTTVRQPDPSDHSAGPSRWPELGSAAAWNLVALGISGLAGIALLVLVGGFYGAAALGSFNLLLAVFLVGGQLGALGIHASVVRHTAQLAQDPRAYRAVLRGALLAVIGSSGLVAGVLWVGRDILATLLGRPELAPGIGVVAVALVLFAVNKVLLSALNGLALFRSYAVLTAARALLLLGALGVLISIEADAGALVRILVAAEGCLLVLLVSRLAAAVMGPSDEMLPWVGLHLRFGVLGSANNLLQELNVRIDVLVLSSFVDDTALGIYSLAAVITEAFAQIPIVIRTVLAPRVIRLLTAGDTEALQELARYVRRRMRLAMLLLAMTLAILYPTLARIMTGDATFSAGAAAFALLLAGVLLAAGDVPMNLLLLQGGRPGKQSILASVTVMLNVIGNFLLIPPLGINGAAAATAISSALSVALLRVAVRSEFRLRL